MWIVYVIQHTLSKRFYIGFTANLEKRLREHNQGKTISTKRKTGEWMLIYAEAYRSKEDAEAREKKLKHHGSSKQKLFLRIKNSAL